jgi:hypothetical protein
MKHDWNVNRHFKSGSDGQRRWDRAYQLLLEWTKEKPQQSCPIDKTSTILNQEKENENSSLCSCLNHSPSSDTK